MITREREIEILRYGIAIADRNHGRPPKASFDVRGYATHIGSTIISMLKSEPVNFVPHYASRDDTITFAKHLIDGDLDDVIVSIFNEDKDWQ